MRVAAVNPADFVARYRNQLFPLRSRWPRASRERTRQRCCPCDQSTGACV